MASQIREDISNGITVIVDRYSYSGAVYSAAKDREDLSLDWAWQPERGLPRPDIWFFLNISPEDAKNRGGYGLERYENAKLQARVGQLFMSLVGIEGNEEMRIVDAGGPKEAVAENILTAVIDCLSRLDSMGPLRSLGAWTFKDKLASA